MIKILLFLLLFSCSEKEVKNTQVKGELKENLAESIAVLKNFVNFVEVKRRNDLNWNEAITSFKFNNFDMIKTSANSQAQVEYKDLSILNIKENSFVIIVENRETTTKKVKVVNLKKGILDGEIKKLENIENEFEIKTSSGTLKIKPRKHGKNQFKINYNKNGALKVENREADIKVLAYKKIKILDEREVFAISAGENEINEQSGLPLIDEKRWGQNLKDENAKKTKIAKVTLDPIFELYTPKNNEKFSNKKVRVTGKIIGKRVLLNGEELKTKDYLFKKDIELSEGLNLLTFQIFYKDDVEYKVLKIYKK